jgi:hypothetical protein
VVFARVLRDPKLGTEKGRAALGDQFLGHVSGIAKVLPKCAVEVVLCV